jgi:hypothetical protein
MRALGKEARHAVRRRNRAYSAGRSAIPSTTIDPLTISALRAAALSAAVTNAEEHPYDARCVEPTRDGIRDLTK